MKACKLSLLFVLLLVITTSSIAQNPIVRTMYSADPTARVFGDRVYLYPSHDILATEGHGRVGWFCMEDYHVFSSDNLSDWADHGIVVTQNKIPWVRPNSYSMWAPDCIYHDGKYYFYFPTSPKDSSYGRGFAIGVAIADKPTGPFIPEPSPIKNVHGIDPNVFIDKNGDAYLVWSQGNIYAAKLQPNLLELASEPKILGNLPTKGLKEGPFMFERNGIYYLTYPHVENKTERLEYAISDNPLGPFKVTGVIMDESPTGCWTNHHSLVEYKNQWYLFYHHNDYSPRFDKARSVRVDSLFFNNDGTIRKVIPTLRGVGLTKASNQIQVDRYSNISSNGVSVDFIDTLDKFKGWKTTFTGQNGWVQYNSVDFGKKSLKTVLLKAASTNSATIEIHTGALNGPVLAEVKMSKTAGWKIVKAPIKKFRPEVQNLFIVSKENYPVEIDWVSFE
ncbi:MAG: family 43 glycosylhydrolase [Candidatus Dadabacteria bacterium]